MRDEALSSLYVAREALAPIGALFREHVDAAEEPSGGGGTSHDGADAATAAHATAREASEAASAAASAAEASAASSASAAAAPSLRIRMLVGLHRPPKESVHARVERRGGYRFFVPERWDGHTPLPLVVALHGKGGDGPSFLW